MKLNMKSLLKDKNVLRVVALVSVLNLLGYLMMQNLDAVAFFIIIGFLTTYFSKNMIVVLLVAMISTNFLVMSRSAGRKIVEGMKNKGLPTTKDVSKDKEEDKEPKGDDDNEEQIMATGKPSKLDEAGTLEKAYENLETMLGSDAIKNMSQDTQQLAKKQQDLAKMVKNMGPMMENVTNIMDRMGGIDGVNQMLEKSKGLMEGLTSITKKVSFDPSEGVDGKKKNPQLEGFAIRG